MKECKSYQELFSEYLFEELSPDAKEKLDQHLVTCPECQAELQQLKATLEILDQDKKAAAVEISESEFLLGVRAKIEKQKQPTRVLVLRPKWAGVALASVLVIILAWSLFKADIAKLTQKEASNLSSEETFGENLTESELSQLLTPETEEDLDQLYIQLTKDYYQKEDLATVLADFSASDFETLENKIKNINLNIK